MKVGVVGLGTMGAGIAQISVAAGHETVGREVSTRARRARPLDDRALPRPRRREGTNDRRGARRGARETHADDRRRGSRRLRPRDRGDRGGARAEARALRRARPHHATGRRPRDEHVGALRLCNRRSGRATRNASSGCTSSTRRRVLPLVEIVRPAARATRPSDGVRMGRTSRQASGELQRHARLHRQPDPDPAAQRLRSRPRRGRRDAGGPRHGDDERRRLADGALRARRSRRHRRARARVGGAARAARRAADGGARASRRRCSGTGSSAASQAQGFYSY